MKKIIFLMLIATLGWQQAGAQTFTFDGLNYNVTSPTTVEVAQNSLATGTVIILAEVTYNNNTYTVTSIGDYAFYNRLGLTSVTIPNSVTSIGNSVFINCTGLTSVAIPNSVTSIGSFAFQYCGNLTSVPIPNSVTSIGNSAFFGCSSLTSINIPNSVTSIDEQAFRFCFSLTSVNIPTSVTNISGGIFQNCTGLTSINIPNSVTSISYNAFTGCSSLTSVTIPNSVTNIGNAAFYGCSGLTSVTVNWPTPLAINNTVFQNVNTPTVVLNVPNGTAAIYDATAIWTDFIITEALSVNPFSATNSFDLIAYPNPSNNVFNFKMNGANDEAVSLLVVDMMGRQIEKKVVNANEVKNIVLGQNYASGVYNVMVTQGRNSKTVRLEKR